MAAPSHEQYILKVTAGSNYDTTKHTDVLINTTTPIKISTDDLDAEIFVRIRDYRGLPHGCPSNSPYFFTEEHKYDRYAISFSFTPKKNISGNDLVFGNDFDHPIRDRLPPGFSAAFRFVKWMIDPGLEGDVYADEPYLYGPVLSSMNIFRIGGKGKKIAMEKKEAAASEGEDAQKEDIEILHEGGDDDGEEIRNEQGIPADSAARKKHFLYENYRKDFEFEQGRTYACDFFNPYLDFNGMCFLQPTSQTSRRFGVAYLCIVRSYSQASCSNPTYRETLGWSTASVRVKILFLSLFPPALGSPSTLGSPL